MRQVLKGSINVSVDVYIIDSTTGVPELGVLFNTAGMDMEYRRQLEVAVNITEVTLAALTTAHADGGFLEIGHGLYRLDVPDAAFATGAGEFTVSIQGTVTGMIVLPQTIQLVDFDPNDAVRMGLTALPDAAADAAGGLPISDLGGLDLDGMNTNINDIETDTAEIGTAGAGLTSIAEVIFDEDMTAHQSLGTFGQAIGDPVADATTIYQAVVTDAAGIMWLRTSAPPAAGCWSSKPM